MEQWALELFGYVASALVVISLMMSSIIRLRVVNLIGAAAFAVYGLLIHAYPVAVVNGAIVLINLYYLQAYFRTKEFFRLLEIQASSDYLRYFLSFYRDEIKRFLPEFDFDPMASQLIVLVLRDMLPAGLFIGERRDEHTLEVKLDFVIPQYRDFKVGRYLYAEQADFFRERGIREVVSNPGREVHSSYLRKMGFQPAGGHDRPEVYRLRLD
jgi:GNAT superfamily N-acetyltransferase